MGWLFRNIPYASICEDERFVSAFPSLTICHSVHFTVMSVMLGGFPVTPSAESRRERIVLFGGGQEAVNF